MCIYIYIYRIYYVIPSTCKSNKENNKDSIYDVIPFYAQKGVRREDLSNYGVRAPVFCGNLREQTGENSFPRIPTGS